MFLVFLFLWILFNGRITLEILLFGVAISAGIYAMCCALFGFSIKKDVAFVRKIPELVVLALILFREIVKANLCVLKYIYGKKKPKPKFAVFTSPLETKASRIILADCITLTPGTITAELDGGKYTVHCLGAEMEEGLSSSAFVKRLRKLEKGTQEK